MVSLSEFLNKYKHIREASPKDCDELLSFLSSIPMELNQLSLRYDLSPQPEKILHYQGNFYFNLVITNDDKSIGGYFVVTLRKFYINGEAQIAGYLSDMRVGRSLSKEGRKEWRDVYNSFMESFQEINEFSECQFFYSAILDDNKIALKTFRRASNPVKYNPLFKYQSINLIARKPSYFLQRSSPLYTTRQAERGDELALRIFLEKQSKSKVMGEYFNLEDPCDEWERRKYSWDNFSINNFILIYDRSNQIVGSYLPWSPKKAKRIIVDKISRKYHYLNYLLNLLGKPTITSGQPINTLYLTHFEISNDLEKDDLAEVNHELLRSIYKFRLHTGHHSITFCDAYDSSLKKCLKNYLVEKIPSTVYQILHVSKQNDLLFHPNANLESPRFEAAIF